jgi:DNA gyrase/topoisomerase IV subunit A
VEKDVVVDEGKLVIARLHTRPIDDLEQSEIEKEHTDELVQMSTALDALGWKKVFVDIIRKETFKIKITMGRRNSHGDSGRSEEDACNMDNLK